MTISKLESTSRWFTGGCQAGGQAACHPGEGGGLELLWQGYLSTFQKVVEDLGKEMSKEVVWPNRIILPLSSAADPRQVKCEMQQVSR